VLAKNSRTAKHVHSETRFHKQRFRANTLLSDVIDGYDSQDPTSVPISTRTRIAGLRRRRQKNAPFRIGVPLEYNVEELSPVIRQVWISTLQRLKRVGYEIYPVSLPATRHALSAYYVLAPAEASSNLARYDGVRYGSRNGADDAAGGVLYAGSRGQGFGDEVKRRILLGAYSLSAE
jgi:aspartyl-tRNA(Asn)/glutamyl-tRNA(Gln) amidotransferase subunit A